MTSIILTMLRADLLLPDNPPSLSTAEKQVTCGVPPPDGMGAARDPAPQILEELYPAGQRQ